MKKILTLLMAVSFIGLTGCGDDPVNSGSGNGDGDVTPDPKPVVPSTLTPGEHQKKLEDIAKEFVSYFDADDHKQIVEAVDALCSYIEEGDYEEPYSARSAEALLSKSGVFSLLRGAASCSEGGVAEAVTRASSPDYSYSLNEYKGTAYVYDNGKDEWIESSIDGDKASLAWDDAQVIVSWINSNKKWTGKVDFDNTAEIYVPQQIKVQMTVAGKEQLALTVTPDLTDNYNVAVKAVCTINGGYALSVDAKADRKGAQASVVLAKGDKKLSTTRGSMAINDATDSDNWFKQDVYTWTDWMGIEHVEKESLCVLDQYIEDNVKTGEVSVDILAASIYAKGDLRKIISDAKAIDDTESKDGALLLSALINANAESYLYYNDTGDKVADVIAQPYMSDYWSYGGTDYEYWDQEPILLFPDGSKFAFEDYFTSKKFSSLIDAVEDLLDAYVKIVENE